MLLAIVVVIILVLVSICLFSERGPHKWNYRNPFNRTCTICGRNEQEECSAAAWECRGWQAIGEWVVYREGDPSKHENSQKKI